VRLVDRDARDLRACQRLPEGAVAQALGRHVDKLVLPAHQPRRAAASRSSPSSELLRNVARLPAATSAST